MQSLSSWAFRGAHFRGRSTRPELTSGASGHRRAWTRQAECSPRATGSGSRRSSQGFAATRNFTRTFTAQIGLTPQEYKRAAAAQHRIQYRIWKDKIDPVRPGSTEYFRRRKRWLEDGRALRRLVAKAQPFGRAKLAANAPPERLVVDPVALRKAQLAGDRDRWADRLEMIRDRWLGDPDRPAFLDAYEDSFEYLDDDW